MVVKRALGCLFVLTLASGILWAQTGPKVAHTTHSGSVTPFKAPGSATLQTIFSNLGPSAGDAYNDESGYYVLGPNNSIGDSEQWIALPFTPTANAHVSEISVAVGWISGEKAFFVGLYSDNSGTVGSELASAETNKVPTFGTCCDTVNVDITSTAVSAGTQYWIVASTDDTKAPAFTGAFMSSNSSTIAYNPAEEGWFNFSGNVPAVLVRGTIP
jgi:hypothetical protein